MQRICQPAFHVCHFALQVHQILALMLAGSAHFPISVESLVQDRLSAQAIPNRFILTPIFNRNHSFQTLPRGSLRNDQDAATVFELLHSVDDSLEDKNVSHGPLISLMNGPLTHWLSGGSQHLAAQIQTC